MKSRSLVPKGSSEVAVTIQRLLEDARDQVFEAHGDVAKDNSALEAEVTFQMLALSEHKRKTLQAAQGFVVAYVARQQLWHFHPDEHASGSLRQFLRSTGLGDSTVSDLAALGNDIVPYCDANCVPIDAVLTPENWSKFRDAIPAARRAAREDDREQMLAIIEDVRQAPDRLPIRAKYRNTREHHGHGTTMRLADGRVLFVALLDDDEAAQTIVHRLDGALEWDLALDSKVFSGTLKVVVDAKTHG